MAVYAPGASVCSYVSHKHIFYETLSLQSPFIQNTSNGTNILLTSSPYNDTSLGIGRKPKKKTPMFGQKPSGGATGPKIHPKDTRPRPRPFFVNLGTLPKGEYWS